MYKIQFTFFIYFFVFLLISSLVQSQTKVFYESTHFNNSEKYYMNSDHPTWTSEPLTSLNISIETSNYVPIEKPSITILYPYYQKIEYGVLVFFFHQDFERDFSYLFNDSLVSVKANEKEVVLNLQHYCSINKYLSLVISHKQLIYNNIFLRCHAPIKINQTEESGLDFLLFGIKILGPIFLTFIVHKYFFPNKIDNNRICTHYTYSDSSSEEEEDPPKKYKHKKKKYKKIYKKKNSSNTLSAVSILIGLVIIGLFFVEKVSSSEDVHCDKYDPIATTLTVDRKIYDKDKSISYVSGHVSISVPEESWSICIELNVNNLIFGLRFVIEDFKYYTMSELQYFTGDFVGVTASHWVPMGEGNCGSGECSGMKEGNNNVKSLAGKEAMKYPGKTHCDGDSYTNFQMGTLLKPLSTGCLYSKGSIKITNSFPVYLIYDIGYSYKVVAYLNGKPISISADDSETLSYRVQGSIVPDLGLLRQKWALFNGEVYLVTAASDKGVCVSGAIGDVQFTKPSDITNNIISNIKFAPSIITNRESHRDGHKAWVTYEYAKPGFQELKNSPKLGVFGKCIWCPDNNSTQDNKPLVHYCKPKTHSPLNIHITFPKTKNISITTEEKIVCPESKNLLVLEGGCKNCASEASFTVEVKSTCSVGKSVVSSDNPYIIVLSKVIEVDSNFKNFTIYYHTTLADVNCNICFDNKSCIPLKTTLRDPIIKLEANNNTLVADEEPTKGGEKNHNGNPFVNWLKKTFDKVKEYPPFCFYNFFLKLGLKKTLLFVGIGLLVVLLIYLSYVFFIRSFMTRKALSRY
ncbi:hypothetical protein ACTFIU_008477 [Dictyostelium citrinum]